MQHTLHVPLRTKYEKKHVLKKRLVASSKHDNHFRLNSQHIWEDLHDNLIFNMIMNTICICAPKIMSKMPTALIDFGNHLVLSRV